MTPTHAMVLAAGLGTRMAPLSSLQPKPALAVLNKPVIAHALERLAAAGVTHAVVNTHHLPNRLRGAVEEWVPEGLAVSWSHEPKILGTAGGLRKAARHFPDAPIFMVNSDCLSDIDFAAAAAAHDASGRSATMVVRPHEEDSPYRPVLTAPARGGTARVVGIGAHTWGRVAATPRTFTGVHVISPEVIAAIPAGTACDINADVYPKLLDDDPDAVGAWLHEGWWFEAGTPAAYLALNLTMLARDGRSAIVGPGFFIDEDARVDRSVLGSGARLERDVVVAQSVLWRNVSVGPGTTIRGCIVTEGLDVPGGASYEGSILMKGKDSAIVVEPMTPSPQTPAPATRGAGQRRRAVASAAPTGPAPARRRRGR